MPRIYGLETEYGLVATSEGGRLTSDEAARRLFAPLASRRRSTNVFGRNGGRLYLDVGNHPEYATPECTSAHDLLVADRAGDEALLQLAAGATDAEATAGRDTTFALYRNNTDAHGNTWGSHENYLVDRATDPAHLAAWLVPFLVSRQLVAGAGRWSRGRFRVSQRCDVLADVVSNATTRSRPLINTRDEPHADPARHRRLHVISGDTNLSEPAAFLKVTATELVLRLAESGRAAPAPLADPLDALRAWGRDPDSPRPTVGGAATARTLQERYCAAAAEHADTPELQRGWRLWRDTLDELAAGRPGAAEWAVKRDVLRAWAGRHAMADADPRLDALDLRWHQVGRGPDGRPLGVARLLEDRGELPRLTSDADVAAAGTTAPSATRARLRGRFVALAQDAGRDLSVDWAAVTVHDLAEPGARRPTPVELRLDDPFAEHDPAAEAVLARLATEPSIRTLGGFVPPP